MGEFNISANLSGICQAVNATCRAGTHNQLMALHT